MKRTAFAISLATLPLADIASAQSVTDETAAVDIDDLRFGYAPVPAAAPGFDPAADARALVAPGTSSSARAPIPGRQYLGSYAAGQRYVIRVPRAWNGSLVCCGTPATRSEFANDLIWSDFLLARGYAVASSNKGIEQNVVIEPLAAMTESHAVYPVPFDTGGSETTRRGYRFGMLGARRVPIERWNDDFASLVGFSQRLLAERHRARPRRTFVVGLSNGGAQVRTILERYPDSVDGGVDWSGVFWDPERSLLDTLPAFLLGMPEYIKRGYRDHEIERELTAAGFPTDVRQTDPAHPSLWSEYYSNQPSFYADVTVWAYGMLLDPRVHDGYAVDTFVPNADDPDHLPGTSHSTGFALPSIRASYTPSRFARTAIGAFAHTGAIGRPLVSIAGTHDAFTPPENHARPYAAAVKLARRANLHELYLVEGGTHVDAFVPFGYGLRAQLPFAWAAFDRLVTIVEGRKRANGTTHTVRSPADIAR